MACWTGRRDSSVLREGPFIAITSGRYHHCGLREQGTVECWFANDDGIRRDQDVGQATPPSGVASFQSVDAGLYHTCGVTENGTVLCWGNDEFGQSTPPQDRFLSVSAGGRHTCGVRIDLAVACWGSNIYGHWFGRQWLRTDPPTLGYSPFLHELKRSQDRNEKYVWAGQASPPAGEFQSVSAGWDHTCGIRRDGSITCWGTPADSWDSVHLTEVNATPPDGVFRSISAGFSHSCAVRLDGVIICWGYNSFLDTNPPGYVAVSTDGADYLCETPPVGSNTCWAKNGASDPAAPEGIPTPAGFTAIVASNFSTCGLTDRAAIACWGATATPPLGEFHSVASGCAVRMDGSIECWGPARHSRWFLDFRKWDTSPPEGTYTSISGRYSSLGRHHFCAIRDDERVACWGWYFDNPILSPSGTFRQISVYDAHACGVRTDGSLHCWWSVPGTLFDDPPPTGSFQSVSVGEFHACAVRDNDRVACWGSNEYKRASPPRGKFKDVSAGANHSCGIRHDDTLKCWGANTAEFRSSAKFGPQTSVYRAHYGQADPPEGAFRAVAAGDWHTCGIRTDGTATCWGANNEPYSYANNGDDYYYGQAMSPAGNP